MSKSEIEQIIQLHHVCMELSGVIAEFRSMPCSSLEQRMFGTLDRYQRRIAENAPTLDQREALRLQYQKEDDDEQSKQAS